MPMNYFAGPELNKYLVEYECYFSGKHRTEVSAQNKQAAIDATHRLAKGGILPQTQGGNFKDSTDIKVIKKIKP